MVTQNNPLSIIGNIAMIGNEQVGENYKKSEFLINVAGKYPVNVHFICFGAVSEHLKRCKVGDLAKVYFAASSSEYKGKYFTELKAYKIEIDYTAVAKKEAGNA